MPSLSILCHFSQGLNIQSQQRLFSSTLPFDWNFFLLSFLLLTSTTLDYLCIFVFLKFIIDIIQNDTILDSRLTFVTVAGI